MAIQVTCECGRALNLKDELEGKRIKCPSCKNSLTVSADDSASSVPKKRNGNGKSNGSGTKKGSSKMLFALVGVTVGLLGCCCLSGGGFSAWYFWPGGSSGNLEKQIVGKWTADVELPKKGTGNLDDVMKLAFGGDIEFKADGSAIDNTPMTPITKGKWKALASKGDMITVELSEGPIAKKLDIKVVSADSIKITPADLKAEFAFKRSK
jgi:hypothetical protein